MDYPIRILHVVGMLDCGGTETLLLNLLRNIDRSKFQFDFVEQTEKKCYYDDEVEKFGSIIYRCPQMTLMNLIEYKRWWRDFYKDHPEYKLIHGHSPASGPIYLKEANKAGRITVAHSHNNSLETGIKKAVRYIWQFPLHYLADYNFACSVNAGISQFGRKNYFKIINNGIQVERYAWSPLDREIIRKEFGISDSFVIGNVARLGIQKNHLFLLDVFAEILKRVPNSLLLLVGDGSQKEVIKEKAHQMGIEEKVIFTGTREDANRMYQAMDAFVLPSINEGLGIVNIEAQASGLPCFVSDVVPPEVKVTDLVTFISLAMSAAEWAEEICSKRILTVDRKDHSKEIECAGFDIYTTAKLLCNIYEDAIKNGKP